MPRRRRTGVRAGAGRVGAGAHRCQLALMHTGVLRGAFPDYIRATRAGCPMRWNNHKPGKISTTNALKPCDRALQGFKAALQGIKRGLNGIKAALMGIKPPVKGIKGLLIDIKGALKGIKAGMLGITSALQGFKGALMGIKSALKGIKTGLLGIKSALKGCKTRVMGIKSAMKPFSAETTGNSERTMGSCAGDRPGSDGKAGMRRPRQAVVTLLVTDAAEPVHVASPVSASPYAKHA